MEPKENLLRAIRHDSPQWVPNGMEPVVMLSPPIVTRPVAAGFDDWGVKWDMDVAGTFPGGDHCVCTDIRQWRKQVQFPSVDACDWTHLTSGWGGQGDRVNLGAIDRDASLVCGILDLSMFERTYLLLGMEQALMAYVAETDYVEQLLGAIADFNIKVIEHLDDAADLDMIWCGDDWGTQTQLFLQPDIWRCTVGKHMRRMYDCMKKRGIIINQHSCGKIDEIFPDIVEMGAQVWNPCQPCNDLVGMKKRFGGRIAFCGGIDSQFVLDRPGVTVDEVRAEVRRRIDEMAAGGGYIASPSHGVQYKAAIIAAMNDEIDTYGREYYLRQSGRR
ncbi:MAG: uroporphyrinogen decarboxylase family protein [bacterium]